jgi:C_GCAxxG_C_C family probable redox protein
MTDQAALKRKVDELAAREWNVPGLTARIRKLSAEGIPRKKLDPEYLLAHREEVLNRVQFRAEEYNFILKSCPQGTALALLEEFGLGNMEVITALTPFPSLGGTGRLCGGVTGSLIALGLYFGSDDRFDIGAVQKTMAAAKKFLVSFEDILGYLDCADILEKVVIGYPINPGESDAAMAKFAGEKGFEKCGLPPGTGARLAAGLIIDSMK